ncbi:uncharacterized protein HMPREF1541_11149 [Cyphellophora europaea CBS 101466]|uniref:Xylanolytic transcriptional activator regulatory domain-containing protein n=1 Tax=Cyphellophora europaea (strain CBS 101466) TaxID=1220924 RepID=W2S5D1_CYPE1|nr:uncharacterized protein HMPREF1541_11149 [Cyphellophora europaea CBS 101466]ETN43825.1 hypothetical protein HMPREF1541_11149 [Cyphellophora europaea CBS 101466]
MIASTFFDRVHQWMPLLSRRRFYQHLSNPFAGRSTDFNLVLLAMKLVESEYTSANSRLYDALRNSLTDVASRGHLTLYTLQASILVAWFEYGHAIYPSAYFSVGFSARLATVLGVEKSIDVENGPWADIEEARRCWWSILLLDR